MIKRYLETFGLVEWIDHLPVRKTTARTDFKIYESKSPAVEKWISRRRALYFLNKDSDYDILVVRNSAERNYRCSLVVRIGSNTWVGNFTARTVSEALSGAIDGLHKPEYLPVFLPKPYQVDEEIKTLQIA